MIEPLSQPAIVALDLARRPDGYLAPSSDVINELRNAGLVTTQNVGDGFMIVKAIMRAGKQRRAKGRWVWPDEQMRAAP